MTHKTTPARIRQTKNNWHNTNIRTMVWQDGKRKKIRLTVDMNTIELTGTAATNLINRIADLLETEEVE
ncbi:hypothetical protein [Corynebacterium sp. HS2168-gen11]|uniref:hypothetical protein n=1 Tax=Corynebacterium sp. HS2168-gen11 TaxID=2974027 RepID=UPI00216B4CEF|nr:hypothetical protein [Corynebacterium sp. HS2168-gen11]MCS4535422.1 hypothetical protein [Corynebacterium sp. HS2168-gen11]